MIKERYRASFVPSLNIRPPPACQSILIYQLDRVMSKWNIFAPAFFIFLGIVLLHSAGAHEQIYNNNQLIRKKGGGFV
jgi:hypothetical protein